MKTALCVLTHSRAHDGNPEGMRGHAIREAQAESVAYAVSAALGLDTSDHPFGCVASCAASSTDEEMRACLQLVRDAGEAMVKAAGDNGCIAESTSQDNRYRPAGDALAHIPPN